MKNLTLARLLRSASAAVSALLFSVPVVRAQNFTTYDLVVPVSSTSVLTTIDGAGRVLPTNRSFVIGLDGGTRGCITIQNFTASAAYPLVIVNHHGTGKVVITDVGGATKRDGITIRNCEYFQLRGDNDPSYRYGIEVAKVGNSGAHLGVSVTGTSSYGELMFLEVHDQGFAGIMVKSDPSCSNPSTWMGNFTMYDIKIHDNYVHDTGGEGMYLGYTHWGEVLDCTAQGSPVVYGHEIHGLHVHHNLVEKASWETLQTASCPVDVQVHDNVLYYGGVHPDTVKFQGGNLAIGGGSTGEFYNNIIIKAYYGCIGVFGQESAVTVYNNLLTDSGDYAIFTKNLPDPPPVDHNAPFQTEWGSFCSFYNNTIIVPSTSQGAYSTQDEVSVNNFKNNIVVQKNSALPFITTTGVETVHSSGNILQNDSTNINFVNETENDYRILATSNAVNIGTPLDSLTPPEVSVTTDIDGNPRPQGGTFDAGLNETGALSVFLVVTPPTTGGGTGTIKASAIGGTSPYTYLWSTSATTQTITPTEGLYTVTVTDNNGAKMKKGVFMKDLATMGAPISDMLALNQVLAPALSPAAGVYSSAQSVSMTTGTSGATIRYTVDGSIPTATTGIIYTGAFTVPTTKTVRAIAYKSGLSDSFVTSGAYQIDTANTKFTIVDANITESSHQGSSNTKSKTIDGSLTTLWQSYSELTYFPSSTWTASTVAGAYSGDIHSGSTTNSYCDVAVYNTNSTTIQVSWYGAVGPTGGIAAVSVDGGTETNVDTYAAVAAQNQLLYTSATLAVNSHTLRVRVTGTKNASSTGYTIVADRFVTTTTTINDTNDRQWLRFDLGSNKRLGLVRMAFNNPLLGNYFFEIQTSTDDVNYTSLVDGRVAQEPTLFQSSANSDTGLQDYDIPDVEPVRYVRIVGHGNNQTDKGARRLNQYTEIELWGGSTGTAPAITTQPSSQTVAPGANVTFSVVATGSPTPTYQWKKGGTDIAGATLPTLPLPNVQAGDAGSYTVVVTNSAGSVTSSTATLTVGVAPTITTQPSSQTVLSGTTATFTVAATGTPSPTYQWQKNGANISGATSTSYVISGAQPSDDGAYTVIVSNSAGSVTSSSATLTVSTILQAENATLVGAVVSTAQTGYTGTGFADYINASGDYVEWTYSNPVTATRTLTFRYASTGSPRNLSITVNGTVVNSSLSFTTTGGANIWALKVTSASLPSGTVLIRATATGTSGPNMDYLQVD